MFRTQGYTGAGSTILTGSHRYSRCFSLFRAVSPVLNPDTQRLEGLFLLKTDIKTSRNEQKVHIRTSSTLMSERQELTGNPR